MITLLAATAFLAAAAPVHASPGSVVPQDLSPGLASNVQQQIALDSGNHPHAVWTGSDGTAGHIYYAADLGSGWSAPLIISPGLTGDGNPQIALDSSNNPHVVWSASNGSVSHIYYSRNTGSGWSAPLIISPGLENNGNPQIALDPVDNLHVVWAGTSGAVSQVYYALMSGSSWSAPLELHVDGEWNANPQIAVDAAGFPHIVWSGGDSSGSYIYYSANLTEGWEGPQNLYIDSNSNSEPRIALDAAGHPHVVWTGEEGIMYCSNLGSGWNRVNISSSLTDSSEPRIALDAAGQPHVVWKGDASPNCNIYYSADLGAGWLDPVNLSPASTTDMEPRIVIDAGNLPHVAWSGDVPTGAEIYYTTKVGTSWSAGLNISTMSANNLVPQIAVDTSGYPRVVWRGNVGNEPHTWYSTVSACFVNAVVPGGHGTAVPASQQVSPGADVSIDLVPDAGYRVSSITDNGIPVPLADPYVITGVTANHAVVVTFDKYGFYFAEGYTGSGFQEYLCMCNPAATPIDVVVTYIFADGTTQDKSYAIPAQSRTTIDVNASVGDGREVSLKCESDGIFVAERPMYFTYTGNNTGAEWIGGSNVMGALAPSTIWYFAEGYTGPGFDEWICVLNPGNSPALLTFNFQTEEEGLVVPDDDCIVPAHSRATFKANDLLDGKGFQASLRLKSDVPVVAERPMYFDYQGTGGFGWTGGHCVMGATALADQYYFAEGYTGEGFEEWLCIQNPGDEEISVKADYQFSLGAPASFYYNIPANYRKTIFVPKEVGPDRDVSVRLSSDSEFLAERPMYFDYHEWCFGGDCVIGAYTTSNLWLFGEGSTDYGFEEWLCIQNPGTAGATLKVYYYPEVGSPLIRTYTVPADSRYSVCVNDQLTATGVSVRVTSDQPIVVERPMFFKYFGPWNGGHVVMGYSPI